ncbi:MAG: AAA family ATPase [Candidatus Acidiferrales bacterium]
MSNDKHYKHHHGSKSSHLPHDCLEVFHSYREFKNAPPITFAIKGFLQNNGATLIGGLSGHGKTFVMLSMVKALLSGRSDKKLWGYFDVAETASRVLYLIPESAITPFKHRLKLFHLYKYLKTDRLLVHTLSKGPVPNLSDKHILSAAKHAHVFLDTAVRFGEGNENEARDNQEGLATDIFNLLRAGARTVVGAHHSPKSFAKEDYMTLENVLRGSGDIGGMPATAWGIKQLDRDRNILHIQNIKPRDFQPCGPFQLIGGPYIDDEGNFRMHKKPGECGSLKEEQQRERNRGGAPAQARDQKARAKEFVRESDQDGPKATAKVLAQRLKEETGIAVEESTIRKYRREIVKAA